MILIVGDADVRYQLVRKLHYLKHITFAEVEHGQQALLALKKFQSEGKQVRLIISPFKMSPISGPGLIHQMKLQGFDIPVVFLSEPTVDDAIICQSSPNLLKRDAQGKILLSELSSVLKRFSEQVA